MKPITQQIVGTPGEGDCLAACAASILETDIDAFAAMATLDNDTWFETFIDALARLGYTAFAMEAERLIAWPGYQIAIGDSPRHSNTDSHAQPGEKHAVVALYGDVVHDPHPSRTGIASVDYFIVLVPLKREPYRLTPESTDTGNVRSVL